jgi:ribonuclease J
MVSLTFYGGVGEIGGNKILLEDHDTKIFLDFGMSFTRRGKYFEEFVCPRTANGIGDFLEMGLLPDIPGVYRTDLLEHQGRKAEEPVVSGVILSHAHADHANYISFLHKDIPIYCGETCKRILHAVAEQSNRDIENEVIDFRLRPLYRSRYKIPPVIRKFHTFTNRKKFTIDSLEIEPISVDHSIPDAYGFIIYSYEGPLIYTGDLRMHGLRAKMTDEFAAAAQEAKPIAMITEGTRIEKKKTNESEQKIYHDSIQKIRQHNALTIVDFNFKDVDRFITFFRIAKDLGKILVINFKHACFLEQYCSDKRLKVPSINDPNLALFKPRRLTGTYIDEDYTDAYIKNRLHYKNIVTAADITKNPSKYMIVLNFWYFSDLVDLKPAQGLYIHSLSEPFNEEMEISYNRMKNWLRHFNLELFQSHCSGHINGDDLRKFIRGVNPKKLYPIHTEHPRLFCKLPLKTIMVKEGKTYKP